MEIPKVVDVDRVEDLAEAQALADRINQALGAGTVTPEKDVLVVLAGLRGVAFDWDTSNPRAANASATRPVPMPSSSTRRARVSGTRKSSTGPRSWRSA